MKQRPKTTKIHWPQRICNLLYYAATTSSCTLSVQGIWRNAPYNRVARICSLRGIFLYFLKPSDPIVVTACLLDCVGILLMLMKFSFNSVLLRYCVPCFTMLGDESRMPSFVGIAWLLNLWSTSGCQAWTSCCLRNILWYGLQSLFRGKLLCWYENTGKDPLLNFLEII